MRVLFVAYGGGHVSMLMPVILQLQALRPDVECVLLALTTGYGRARSAGFPALRYVDFLHLVDAEQARHWGRLLYAGNNSPDVDEVESIAYLGVNYLDLIAQYGEAGAAAHYATHGRYGFKPLHFMRKLFKALRPGAVVATNSPRSEQAALEVAVELGIPSVGMVDLFGLDTDTYVLREIKPSYTCVIADSVAERLLLRGFPEPGLRVTGNPAFDGLFDAGNTTKAREFLAAKGWQDKKVILYIGAWEPVAHPNTEIRAGREFPVQIEHILRDYAAGRDDIALVVRYHPGDWFEYTRLPDTSRVYFSEPPRELIHPLILACTVVVNTNSTVGLEAAIAGKPVISIENSPSVHAWFSLAELGVSYPSPTHLDLADTLDRVIADPQAKKAFQSDGKSAARVAGVVLEALDHPVSPSWTM